MRCDILSLFPSAVEPYLSVGVLGRAGAAGVLDVRVHDLR
jgi:tRNA G37 N-methylase TrmD